MHTFESERLLFRPLAEEDRSMFISLFTDVNIMRYIGDTLDEQTAISTFETALKNNLKANQKYNTWAIIEKINQKSIGIIYLFKRPELHQAGDIEHGLMIERASNGKLYPEEACEKLIEYAFSIRHYKRVLAVYKDKNLATKRILKKLRFSFDETSFTGNKDEISSYLQNPIN